MVLCDARIMCRTAALAEQPTLARIETFTAPITAPVSHWLALLLPLRHSLLLLASKQTAPCRIHRQVEPDGQGRPEQLDGGLGARRTCISLTRGFLKSINESAIPYPLSAHHHYFSPIHSLLWFYFLLKPASRFQASFFF